MNKLACLILAAAALIPPVEAQSPPKVVNAAIAGKNIKMDYFSPSMRGRKIYGGLVPYGQVWCPGANWATTITVDSDFQLGTLKLKKGTYALWVLPKENDFELIVNSNARAFHLDYKSDTDIGRMKMNLKTLDKPVESLTFEVRNDVGKDGGNKGTVALIWEKTEASVPIVFE
jgi:hypothetical protein